MTVITNIHEDAPEKVNVNANIDKKVYNYFFRHCLAGSHGPRQAFITFFYQRFYEACVLNGIAPVYDEENERKMWEILQKLNFSHDTPASVVGLREQIKYESTTHLDCIGGEQGKASTETQQ